MLFVSLLVAVIGIVVASSRNPTNEDKAFFDKWKVEHRKVYSHRNDEMKAFRTFLMNRDVVESINANSHATWKAALNQFADLTSEEFAKLMLLPTQSANSTDLMKRAIPKQLLKAAPESFDWRTDSSTPVVTAVRDQGSVGSCWAFSTVQNVEGQWALAGHDLVELSPEFLVDCDGTSDPDAHHADCSVFGGWPYLAYQYIIKAGGVPSEADWPYCSGTGDCFPCMAGPIDLCGPPPLYCDRTIDSKCKAEFPVAAKISSWTALTTDESQLTSELYTRGPLSVLLDATQLQFYSSGVWDGHLPNSSPALGCHASSLNHAVLMVGYGTDGSSPYWTVKNSWGAKWGENGYFRITRGQGKCGINTAVTTSLV